MSITVFEFSSPPNANGDPAWPAQPAAGTTMTSGQTITLSDSTAYIVVCADVDARIGINTPATTTGKTILSAVDNGIRIGAGKSRTLAML